jgi:cytochrome P450
VKISILTAPLGQSVFQALRPILIKGLQAFGLSATGMMDQIKRRVKKRIELGTNQKDMMTHIIGHISEDGDGISLAELAQTSFILMLAGSETTATTLAGAMFYLLKNKHILSILTEEIRGNFESDEDVTIIKV